MWTPAIVRSRFIEACDTERRLPLGGGSSSGGFWPAYVHTFEDMNGWGTKRLAEEREMRFKRVPPSAAAISRFEEVMEWSGSMISDDTRRKIIWTWAACQVSGHSFASRCRKFGWVKMTAYRRLHAISDAISRNLNNDAVLLRMPDEKWVLPNHHANDTSVSTLEELPEAVSPQFWTDGSTSADQPDIRDFSWAAKQAEREAKRRRKAEAGVPDREKAA